MAIAMHQGVDVNNYLTIRAREDGLTAKLASDAVEYCVDGDGNWKTLEAGVATEAINANQTLSFRANYTAYNTSRRFTISASNCLLGWVNAIKSSGTFYKNKDATWTTTGISGVPSGWTVVLV